MATALSDLDVYVVLAAPDPAVVPRAVAEIDIPVCTLDQLRHVPGPTDAEWWDRYSFTHSQVLLDRTDGELTRLVDGMGHAERPREPAGARRRTSTAISTTSTAR